MVARPSLAILSPIADLFNWHRRALVLFTLVALDIATRTRKASCDDLKGAKKNNKSGLEFPLALQYLVMNSAAFYILQGPQRRIGVLFTDIF